MHEVGEGDLYENTLLTVLLSHTKDPEIPELANAKTNLLEYHQDNGATPPVYTQ